VAGAVRGGQRLGLLGRLQRPAQPAAATVAEQLGRREEGVVREEEKLKSRNI